MTLKTRTISFDAVAVALLALSAALLGGKVSVARADTVVTVPSFFCVAGTQVAFRPAGSTIVIRSRYAEQTRGTLTNFLEAQTTTLSINGGAAIDGTNLYSAPFFVPDFAGTSNGVWEAGFDTPTGITLTNPGDSLTFHIKLAVSHPVAEVLNPADGGSAGKPGIIGPGTVIDGDCTVIAT
jgi:hypothetical protein